MKPLKTLFLTIYGSYCWVLFVVLSLCAVVFTLPVPSLHGRRHITRAIARCFLALAGFRLKVNGLKDLPNEACVVVANHASYLDGLVFHALLPVRFAFIIKKEMVTVPLAGFLLRRLGSEFVDRFNRHRAASDVRRVLRRAASGEALVCFPEGTFSSTPGIHKFHAGAFVAAARAGLPIVPMTIRGTREILPDGRLLPWPGSIQVDLLCCLAAAEADDPQAPIRLRQQSKQLIMSSLGEPDLDTLPTKRAPVEPAAAGTPTA